MKIKLGNTYRDRVTGFTGVATCYTKYLTGCDRVGLQPPIDKDGKIPDSIYFDSTLLELIKKKVIKPEKIAPEYDPGGPQSMPRSIKEPK
jgi:hypothetical protein